ncbi:ABC transporter permease [Aureimonas sp. Leaf460]|nr:ABC transporter permease [Aureimonas sp. Leaf427]KQT80529.1 ABC transporter permease [Aureimonas sp. Leaf460]
MSGRSWALLFVLGGLWGGSFFLTQIVIRELPPLPLVGARLGLAALALLVYLRLRGISFAPLRQRAGDFLILGLLNNAVPFLLLAIGQTRMGGGLASILNATTPLWTILVAAIATSDERLTGRKLAGVMLGIVGVAVLVGPEAFGTGHSVPVYAFAAILAATFCYALSGVFSRRFKGVPPAVVATGQLCASGLMMMPLVLAVHGPLVYGDLSGGGAVALLALALGATALAFILFFQIVAAAGATNASLVTFLVPASAILLGVLFHGEALTAGEVGGFALILAGLAAIDGRIARLIHAQAVAR